MKGEGHYLLDTVKGEGHFFWDISFAAGNSSPGSTLTPYNWDARIRDDRRIF